ncbi:ABC transporter A family member 1 [Phytophthora rubi]|uniref:ABC transporter A family member 1 n=1 Tax=Phytophthora rubi TaxID=129364 RepID=A0A6A3MZN7_9STRA|nr:ABC transporter A family member 1 [Phytophthora rubi]KAE9034567.1 ABC transporter A family member 1 [Phytophthora rubi]KAE9340020.1 ABC transporter A family member 1 [Phytophthora rubi]
MMPDQGKQLAMTANLSERRTAWTFLRALLWKNWLIKRRHPVATACEVLVPVVFILLLGLLKSTTTTVAVPSGWSDTSASSGDAAVGTSYNLFQPTGQTIEWVSADLPKFALHESSMTGLLLKLGVQSVDDAIRLEELSTADQATCTTGVIADGLVDTDTSSEYRVPSECADKVSPYKIAIAPDNAFTRSYFTAAMDLWYPRLELLNSSLTVPSFSESVELFNTNDELTAYVKSDNYGKGVENPRVYAAIVFDSAPVGSDIGSFASIEYSLRLNSTEGDSVGRVPGTSSSVLDTDPFQTDIDTDYYSRYTVTGFMTLQTLVTRFVSCMPEWDSSNQSTTGVCQRPQTTAVASTSLDSTLMQSLSNDALIQEVFNTGLVSGESSFSSILDSMSNDTKELLLTPLRQAPQPFIGATVAPFPVTSFDSSSFYDTISDVFPVIFALAYLFTISRILVVFIQEKELRLREFMKILGVTENTIIVTWYMTYTAILFVGAVVQAVAGLVGLFPNTSVILTFLFFWLFGMSVLALAYLISTIFNKARVGSFVGMVVFFFMHVLSQAFTTGTAEMAKTIGCLLSPVGLSLGVQVLADAETTGAGVTFANVSALSSNFRFSTALWMFAFDTVLYTLIGMYFEKVMPKEYGTSLKWYFPVSPSYWRSRRQRTAIVQTQGALLDDVALDVNPNIEKVNAELREQERNGEALTVQRLRKVFSVPGGEKVAVQGLNVTMYRDQITCLLGHNGAGKTTLISMLTGMTAPSSGNATYRGMSINEDMDELRRSLGICFQHDVLFPDLSVEEHLLFFGQIKGYANQELLAVAEKQIREVGLTEKRNSKPNDLSGGMKRKLSVAVSLLGDSSLVFLDEPTSGMDPYSRRSTWEILLNNRNDRVMVLTTHFMDEADILGDRIAIMAEGELRCCGSSLFLKNRFGAGYNLTLVKDDAKCDDKDVSAFVTSYVPSAQLLSNVGSEIAFQLPLSSSSQFATMFVEMDNQLQTLGLLSYGVSVTTLEEVFIKVAELGDETNQHTLGNHVRTNNSDDHDSYQACDEIITTESMFRRHLRALLLKRFRYAKRDKKTIIYSALLPVLLIAAGLLILKSSASASDNPNMALTTDAYSGSSTPTPYFCQAGASTGEWCSEVMTSSFFSGADAQTLSVSTPAFDSNSPTVFDVTYTDPALNASGATGYSVAMGQQLYNRGYGQSVDLVEGQYGAYLVYGDSDQNLVGYNVFTNTTAPHSSAIFKALMDQAVYRFFAANSSTGSTSTVNLKVNNFPLPVTAATKAFSGSAAAFVSAMFICIAFTFLPASIVVFVVKEKQAEHNSKHQQLVSGVSLPAFWLSNYIWDLIMYIVPCVCALLLIYIFNVSSMTGQDCNSCTSATFPAVVLLFILFGLAICPFTYCMSFLFKEHAAAQTYTIMANFIIGVVLMIASFIMSAIDSTSDIDSVLVFIWRLSPLFNLGMGLLQLVLNDITYIRFAKDEKTSPFSGDIMGFELAYLLVTAIGYMALAVYLDYRKTFPKVKDDADDTSDSDLQVDADVEKEAQRVASGAADGDAVKLVGLRKVYPGGKVAVRDLSFGLKRGECFGFLGINGAGKTTTMKMLTGDVQPTHGTATLNGFDILSQQIEVRRQIGYCPQFDALFDLLTVREHLELFGAIKGVPQASVERVVMEKIQQLNLSDFEHKLAGSLSGGNKRKLSVAIAMIGNPAIIFLDEPSTGMDPVSRRFMWDVIADISTRGKESTIVLTTHSMEECEALCSRVGIMVGGRLRCYGSVQHLKSRFGDGLVFDVKLDAPSSEELEYLLQHVFGDGNTFVSPMDLESKCRAFGNAELAERITASHPSGYSLAAAMERDGFIRAEAFCSWCVEETRFDSLNDYLLNAFGPGGVLVMERQNDFCRFKVRGSNNEIKLSKMFALVEDVKSDMYIREYSVSQTTLEQIFNSFASQQEEEKGVARGVFQA